MVFGMSAPALAKPPRDKDARRIYDAVNQTTEAGSSRIEGSVVIEAAGETASLDITGAVDFDSLDGLVFVDMSSLGVQEPVEMRLVDGVIYVSVDHFPIDEALPPGTHWVAQDPDDGLDATGGADATASLESLLGVVGTIEEIGVEEVRDVRAMHYRLAIDPGRALREMPRKRRAELEDAFEATFGNERAPVDVWIDDMEQVRRVQMMFDGPDGSLTISFDFFDYGVPVEVEAPSPVETVDYEDVIAS